MSDATGKVFGGRYRADKLIGHGGMSTVYQGTDTMLEREVAIKLLSERTDVVRKRFLREAQSMAHLNHPNIVCVYDAGEDHDQLFIIMELARGMTLRDLAAKGLNFERSLQIFIELLQALEYAHKQSVIHRDVKPTNIMILEDDTVKVMDFGLSRRVSDATNVTLPGEIIGTIAYLPPERFLGKPSDLRADLYSVGCVMYEIFTGQVPFKSPTEDLVTVIFAHVNEPPVPPRAKNPAIPPALERIILKLIEKDVAQRYASATDVIADLKNVQRQPSGAPQSPHVAAAAQSKPNSAAQAGGQAAMDIKTLLNAALEHERKGNVDAVKQMLNRAVSPAQVLQHAQREALTGMLAARKQDYIEASRAFTAALDGFRAVNNELEYARTALHYGVMNVERYARGEPPAEKLNGVINALSESLPYLQTRRLYDELAKAERTLSALRTIKVGSER
ncbi:MAG: protein kinase domain-containing protein [Polyangiaceae bacterium]